MPLFSGERLRVGELCSGMDRGRYSVCNHSAAKLFPLLSSTFVGWGVLLNRMDYSNFACSLLASRALRHIQLFPMCGQIWLHNYSKNLSTQCYKVTGVFSFFPLNTNKCSIIFSYAEFFMYICTRKQ